MLTPFGQVNAPFVPHPPIVTLAPAVIISRPKPISKYGQDGLSGEPSSIHLRMPCESLMTGSLILPFCFTCIGPLTPTTSVGSSLSEPGTY